MVGDYLNALANKSGIGLSEDIDDNFEKLALWDIVDEEDKSLLDKALDYDFLSKTICKLLAESGDPLTVLRQKGYLSYSDRAKAKVKEEKALAVIDKAVKQLNEPQFEPFFEEEQKQEFHPINEDLAAGDLIYKDDACQIVTKADGEDLSYRPADYEEVFEKLNIETSDYVDFNQAVIVPYGEVLENTSYINEKYELLALNDPHVFTSNGFRVSYSLNTSGIDFHISKNEEGLNAYLDISIHNVKPRLKWLEERNDLKNCFFTLDFNTTEKLGISCGRYKNYRMKFKDLDAKSFKSLLNSLFVPVKEDDEVSIPLCKIKVPIAQIPTAFLNMDLKVKLHASGKSEFVLYNAHKLGFETKGGKIRYINKKGDKCHRYFLNCINIGLTADIMNLRRQTRRLFGSHTLAFVVSVFVMLFHRMEYKMKLKINSDVIDRKVMTVCIGSGPGYGQTPNAVPYNGMLDVSVVYHPEVVQLIEGLWLLVAGRFLNHRSVHPYRTREVEVEYAKKAIVGIDGRMMKTPVGSYKISVEQEVVNFLIPS